MHIPLVIWLRLCSLPVNSCQFWFVYAFCVNRASLEAQGCPVKPVPAMRETRVWSLGQEDPLEKEMATHCSTLAWRIPWREEPGRLQSMGSQRVSQTRLSAFTFAVQGTQGQSPVRKLGPHVSQGYWARVPQQKVLQPTAKAWCSQKK